MTFLNVVTPVLNEEEVITEFYKEVTKVLNKITSDYQIIFVDDGSTDKTWEIIDLFSKNDTKVRGIKLSRNFGHHYALTAGLNFSNAEWTIVMDSDLQDRPENIIKLVNKAKEGFDVVFVNRKNRTDSWFYKILQKTFYKLLNYLSGIQFDARQANYSIISKKVVDNFNNFSENARFYGSTILWLGFKRTSIDADHGERYLGKTSYNLKSRVRLALDIILSFSDRPLRLAIYMGFILSLFSLLIVLYMVYSKAQDNIIVLGWASLISSIFLVGGINISILGIVGIYISKIFNQVKSRPLYIVEKSVNF